MKVRCPKCTAEIDVPDATKPQQLTCAQCGVELAWRPKAPEAVTCPACGIVAAPGAVLCVECGLNIETGTPTRVADEEPVEEAPPSLPMRALQFVGEWMPGLLRPMVLVLSIVVGILGLGILAFGLALFGVGAIIGAFAVAAAGVIVYAHAVAWLIDGGFGLLSDALVDFDGPRWGIFFLLLILPFVSVFLLIRVLLAPA